MERFTMWLSKRERERLDELAAENNCSRNYLLRVAWRAACRLPLRPEAPTSETIPEEPDA